MSSLNTDLPYSRIASFYDALMDHVDYEGWADYLDMLSNRFLPEPPMHWFDAACGTGRLLDCFDSEGMTYVGGMDLSAPMMELAKHRLRSRFPAVDLFCGDICCDGPGQKVELLSCLYDSVNYLLEAEDLLACLKNFRGRLQDSSILVLDICTRANSMRHFRDYYDSGTLNHWNWMRKAWFEEDTNMHHNRFIVKDTRNGKEYHEHHQQRIYSIEEMQVLFAQAGLEQLACYANFGFDEGTEDADRVHFVLGPEDPE